MHPYEISLWSEAMPSKPDACDGYQPRVIHSDGRTLRAVHLGLIEIVDIIRDGGLCGTIAIARKRKTKDK